MSGGEGEYKRLGAMQDTCVRHVRQCVHAERLRWRGEMV